MMKYLKLIIAILLLVFKIEIVSANIICNDGTESPSCGDCHPGCCSHHDGCSNGGSYNYYYDTSDYDVDKSSNYVSNNNINTQYDIKEETNDNEDNSGMILLGAGIVGIILMYKNTFIKWLKDQK